MIQLDAEDVLLFPCPYIVEPGHQLAILVDGVPVYVGVNLQKATIVAGFITKPIIFHYTDIAIERSNNDTDETEVYENHDVFGR